MVPKSLWLLRLLPLPLSFPQNEQISWCWDMDMDTALCIFMIADLKRLLEVPHTIDKKPLKVIKQPPKKKVPLDPLKVHVQGLNEKTTKDSLCLYLEKFSKVDVTEVYMGCNNNAMAVFDAEPGNNTYSYILLLFFCERSKLYLSKRKLALFQCLNICLWFCVFWPTREVVQFLLQSFKGIPSFESTVLSLIYACSLRVVNRFFHKLKLFRLNLL